MVSRREECPGRLSKVRFGSKIVVQEIGLADKMTDVSTAGGATLKLLEGAASPGVQVLLDTEQWEVMKCALVLLLATGK